MSKIFLALLIASVTVFASGGAAEGGTDIVPRTINFLIFAGIIWYLIAEPVKNFFVGRSKGIADELDKVQTKLRESKEAKEGAMQKVEDAKTLAAEIMAGAEKEKKILSDKVMNQCDADLVNLDKQNTALMNLEERKAIRDIVDEVMIDVMAEASASFDKEKMAQIIMKKVA